MPPYHVNMLDPSCPSPDDATLREAIEQLYFAYRAFTAPPDRILQQRGLGRVHHRILYFVGHRPGITVNGLCQTLAVTKQALHAPLRHLLSQGLVTMQPAAHDRRVRCLELTPAGRALEARLTATQLELLRAAFAAAGMAAATGWLATTAALAAPDCAS